MELYHAIILGVIEGITEFLPISSTGHLILANSVLGIPQTEFLKSFDIAIQVGAIFAVVVLYFKEFLKIEVIKKLIIAFIPTGLIGISVYPLVKSHLLDNPMIVAIALGLGGVALILFEWWHSEHEEAVQSIEAISYKQALAIGVFQSIAIIPGVSRSAATILGGLWLGLSRTTIVAFSFLLAVPTMIAATSYDMFKQAAHFSTSDMWLLLAGCLTSFLVALAAIQWLIKYIRSHSFTIFGVYRIGIAILVLLLIV